MINEEQNSRCRRELRRDLVCLAKVMDILGAGGSERHAVSGRFKAVLGNLEDATRADINHPEVRIHPRLTLEYLKDAVARMEEEAARREAKVLTLTEETMLADLELLRKHKNRDNPPNPEPVPAT